MPDFGPSFDEALGSTRGAGAAQTRSSIRARCAVAVGR